MMSWCCAKDQWFPVSVSGWLAFSCAILTPTTPISRNSLAVITLLHYFTFLKEILGWGLIQSKFYISEKNSIQKFILQVFAIIDDTSVMNFGKHLQYDFPKMRGRGFKGRLELFRKFIRFGRGMRPLVFMFFILSHLSLYSCFAPIVPGSGHS